MDSMFKRGGRPKGSKTRKKTFRAALVLARQKISPVEELLKIVPLLEPPEQAKLWKYLHEFVDVRPTAIQEADERADALDDNFEDVSTAELIALAKRDK